MKTTLVFGFVAGAIALDCNPGYKHKATLTNLKCAYAAVSAASCTSGCCDLDPLKCGGKNAMTGNNKLDCGNDHYPGDMGLSGTAQDTWENKATTAGNEKTDCCVAKATCASEGYTCPAGMKKVSGATAKCTNTLASCSTTADCCENDALTCHGVGLVMADCTASSKYFPPDRFTATERTNAWKGTATTATNKGADCCATKAKCSAATCPAGMKAKTSAADTECTGNALTCVTNTCCENDVTKCGGLTGITCTTGYKAESSNTWKAMAATEATKVAACCLTKAKCSTYTCPAGYKQIAAHATTDCGPDGSGMHDEASCTSAKCCEANTLTCGGNNAVTTACTTATQAAKCPMGGGGAHSTDACKNTAFAAASDLKATCCEDRATCDAFKTQTTADSTLTSGTYQLRPVLTMAMAVIAFLSMGHK